MIYSDGTNVRRRARVDFGDCGIGLTSQLLGDKWILLILREALFNVIRFEDLRQDLQIPKSVLSRRLALLVDNNIMEKRPYREINTRVRYSYHLTRKGRGLFKAFLALMEWGNEFMLDRPAKYIFIDKHTNLPVKLGLIDSKGQQVPQKAVSMIMTKRI
jgi:DNA-binding HxlR family transcriptional regulator